MKILLINTNPVVSRLTALSARKEGIDLDEVKDISEVKDINSYSIVFVDSDINSSEVIEFLKNSNIKRRVIFASQDDKRVDSIYNFTILKPFLPSEVSSILRDAKIEIDTKDLDEDLAIDTQILENQRENSKEEDEEYINLSKLISTKNNTPIREESKAESAPTLQLNREKEKIEQEEKISLFEIDKETTKKDTTPLETILEEDREDESINSSLFSLDKESREEVDFDALKSNEKKQSSPNIEDEPKILDKDEISNIKTLLDETTLNENNKIADKEKIAQIEDNKSQSLQEPKESIENIQTQTSEENIKLSIDDKKDKKKKNKLKKRVFKDTVGSLPIEELRQLLRGTKIHITIEFPKEV